MFRKELFSLIIAIMVLSITSIAQSTTSAPPPPTPKPAMRPPMLDQFGLSNGVFANGPAASAESEKLVTKVEYVDESTFDTIRQLIESLEFIEVETSYALRNNVDISPAAGFTEYLRHHIVGIVTVSDAKCTGRFGGEGIKSGELKKLMQQNEKIASEIVAVLDAGSAEYAQFRKELNGVSEKYGVALLGSASDGNRLDKPALLKAMMGRMNRNYALVKKMMRVEK